MTECDLVEVTAIEGESFAHPWSEAHFRQEIDSPHGHPLVALDEARVVGYLCLSLVLDEAEILDVAVAPSRRSGGIGRALVQSALSFCREHGAAFVALEVRVGNAAARALYLALGFRETGVRRRYYQDGEDAVLMQYHFSRAH